MFYAVQAMGEIDPARREEIDHLIQSAIAGHDCETDTEVECGMEVFASSSHNDPSAMRKWLGLEGENYQPAHPGLAVVTEMPPDGETIPCPYDCGGEVVEQDSALRWNVLVSHVVADHPDMSGFGASTDGDYSFEGVTEKPFICNSCLKEVTFDGPAGEAITDISYY